MSLKTESDDDEDDDDNHHRHMHSLQIDSSPKYMPRGSKNICINKKRKKILWFRKITKKKSTQATIEK